jgi:hypothetical protein
MAAAFTSTSSHADSVSLWWRQAPAPDWVPLAGARALDPEGSASYEFEMPDAPFFEVGAYAGSSAEDLLAHAGWRRASSSGLRAYPSPAAEVVNFQAALSSSERELQILDLRGRLVTALRFPAQLTVVSWDGRDDAGRRVASGCYLARLHGAGTHRASFVIVR